MAILRQDDQAFGSSRAGCDVGLLHLERQLRPKTDVQHFPDQSLDCAQDGRELSLGSPRKLYESDRP